MDRLGAQPSSSKLRAREISHVGLIATVLESLRRRAAGGEARPDLWQEICSFELRFNTDVYQCRGFHLQVCLNPGIHLVLSSFNVKLTCPKLKPGSCSI